MPGTNEPADTDTTPATASLVARIEALERELKEQKPRKRDFVERLSQLSTLITGGAIAAVGAVATIYYNHNQDQLRRLEAIDKFRAYLSENKTPEDRKFGYYALTLLGQEKLAVELITLRRDAAGREVLASIATTGKDRSIREAAEKGIAVLQSTRPGCEALYTITNTSGFVKFLNGWEEANLVEVNIPQLARIPHGPKDSKVRFNKLAAAALREAFAEIEQKGLLDRVVSLDGAYSPRTLRGIRSRLSAHACGLAFDINVAANPYGKPPPPAGTAGSVVELVPIFERHGFRWGGNFKPRPDPGHFEFDTSDLAAQNASR